MAPLCPNSPFLQPRASQCGPGVLQRNRRPGRLPRPHPTSPPFPSQGDMAALLSSQRFMPDFYSCYFPSLSFSVQFTLFKAQPRHCPAVPPGRAGLWSESGFLWSYHHPWLPMSHLGSSEQALNPAPTRGRNQSPTQLVIPVPPHRTHCVQPWITLVPVGYS